MSKNQPVKLEISFSWPSKRWENQKKIEKLTGIALQATQDFLQKKKLFDFSKSCSVDLVFSHDSAVKKLNAEWRFKDKATNVLSFPSGMGRFLGMTHPLGDIVLAYQTTQKEALAADKPFLNHVIHLIIHGFLHLCHFDHEEDAAADQMEKLEIQILKSLDIPNPYRS